MQKIAKACIPGYSGINCTVACPYPTHGHNCQGFCDCEEDICDLSTGCTQITTDKISSVKKTIIETNDCNNDCEENMCNESTGCTQNTTENIYLVQTTNNESANYYITETVTSGKTPSKSNTKQILILFIAMIGCIDIILLAAYVIFCIRDQRRRQKKTKFSSRGQQSIGRSTAYENIEVVSLFSAR
uniref:Uncharacterized protein n=1 Tax=Magallana gigas TaxID=29159 RepID=A0A8W8JIE3_MAGGI